MDEEKYKLLCQTCDGILLAEDAKVETIAIPWLHVMREHPIFLRQYDCLFTPPSIWNALHKYFYYILKKALQLIKLVCHLFKMTNNFWIGGLKEHNSFDFIFISHLLNESDLSIQNDFYFNKIPQDLLDQDIKVLIVLINQTSLPDRVLNSRVNTLKVPRLVVPKFLPIIEEFRIWRRTHAQSNNFRKSAKFESREFRKRVLKKASLEASSNATQISLRISAVIGEIIKKTDPKAIITTYEGHAWERLVFAKARTINPQIKCIGYQHAALFRLQHAAKRSISSLYDPDLILTAGPVGLRQLKSSESFTRTKFDILGSNRLLKISKSNLREMCLVLPEGILKECEILFSFSLKCAICYPNVHFIWRLHPIITHDMLKQCSIEFVNLPSNIEISSQNFENDIAVSKWALYRGSTAIITAAANGVIPIYLAQTGELSIDPLYEMGDSHPTIENSHQFLGILESAVLNPNLTNYCTEFYRPFDISILTNQLI